MAKSTIEWYRIDNEDDVFTPALLVYPGRIEENIRRMIAVAGDAGRLRPHVKTHKMPHIIRLQIKHGITKFKCATIAEAEMTAGCGAPDVLLAYQPAGPNVKRFFSLVKKFPGTKFSCIADSEEVIVSLSENAVSRNLELPVWLDINVGMNRTGIAPGSGAVRLAKLFTELPGLKLEGLHVYDGHLHEPDPALRKKQCDEAYSSVNKLTADLSEAGIGPLRIVVGGSPTFPVHAERRGVELSPGTILLWDQGYSSAFRDMEFMHAAVLLSRVVSKPAKDLICIDLGHKAVASEMKGPRIHILSEGHYEMVSHNEEHMVLRSDRADNLQIGSVLYGIPYHICPTVDRHESVSVVSGGKVTEEWKVEARHRKISI